MLLPLFFSKFWFGAKYNNVKRLVLGLGKNRKADKESSAQFIARLTVQDIKTFAGVKRLCPHLSTFQTGNPGCSWLSA
jgi:hypothetical protein